jgi:hypothetical protein
MTKFTPYAVLFGRKAHLPGHLYQKFVIHNYDDINSHIKFYFNFFVDVRSLSGLKIVGAPSPRDS